MDTPASLATEGNQLTAVAVLGSPGSGKGTLCSKCSGSLGYYHLSVGDWLRSLGDEDLDVPIEARGGLSAEQLKLHMMDETVFLSAKTIVDIVRHKINSEFDAGRKKFLLDGFPRTLESAVLFDDKIATFDMVLLTQCSKDNAKLRYLDRRRNGTDTETKFESRYTKFLESNPAIVNRYGAVLQHVDTNCNVEKSQTIMLDHLRRLDIASSRPPAIESGTFWPLMMKLLGWVGIRS